MFHEVTLYRHILAGVEPAAGSEESTVACLGLPEFPKDSDERVPTPSTKPKLSAAGSHTPAGSMSDLPSTSVSPFVLSEGLSPVPAELVAKFQKGNCMDVTELLRDNMEWRRRQSTSGFKSGSASRWEVPDLLSWRTCLGIYASVICDKSPEIAKQLLAYKTLIVCEARRCGSKG